MATIFEWPTEVQYQAWSGVPVHWGPIRRRIIDAEQRQRNHDAEAEAYRAAGERVTGAGTTVTSIEIIKEI